MKSDDIDEPVRQAVPKAATNGPMDGDDQHLDDQHFDQKFSTLIADSTVQVLSLIHI